MSPVDPAVPAVDVPVAAPAPEPRKPFKPTTTQLVVAGFGCLLAAGFFVVLLAVAGAVYFLRSSGTPSPAPAPAPLINIDIPVPKLPAPLKHVPAPAPHTFKPFNVECPYCHGVHRVQPNPAGAVLPPQSNPKVSHVPAQVQDAATYASCRVESHA